MLTNNQVSLRLRLMLVKLHYLNGKLSALTRLAAFSMKIQSIVAMSRQALIVIRRLELLCQKTIIRIIVLVETIIMIANITFTTTEEKASNKLKNQLLIAPSSTLETVSLTEYF